MYSILVGRLKALLFGCERRRRRGGEERRGERVGGWAFLNMYHAWLSGIKQRIWNKVKI